MADLQPLSPEILQQAMAQMQAQPQASSAITPIQTAQIQTPNTATSQFGTPQYGSQESITALNNAKTANFGVQDQKTLADIAALEAGPGMLEYGQFGLQGLGALTNVMGYFDNKKTQKLQREGLRTNIANAKQTQANTQEFRGGTKSAFA